MKSRLSWFRPWFSSGLVLSLVVGAFAQARGQDDRASSPNRRIDAPTAARNSADFTPEQAPTLNFQEPKDASKPAEAQPKAPEAPKSAWYDHPKVRIFQRPGYFGVLPTGEGYYSFIDWLHDHERKAPPKSGYPAFALMPPSFFDADFRYVDDPKATDLPHFDPWHRIHLGNHWLFATGGQAWWRHMHETSSRFTGRTNDYDLLRTRVFADLWYQDSFRFYAELISAHTLNQDLAPLAIDRDRIDFQNLFFDIKLAENCGDPIYARVGRQELLFGSQRLVSPPDWANVRRTFQGVRVFKQSKDLDIDLFWVRPIIPNVSRFNSWDDNQNFAGAWTTYRPKAGQAIDLYYLYLDNINTVTAQGVRQAPTLVHTIGSRYIGDLDKKFLWDFEAMFQTGERGGNNIRAGAATAGLGYHCADLPMNPTVWAYYDWASGDPSTNRGDYNTFNQLFPFGHYYLGWIDLVGRQNIRDWNAHLYLYPAKWITFNVQYHAFQLDRATDALYGIGGQVQRVNTKGAAGGNVGNELDLIANFHMSARSDILVGYSKLFVGDFIRNTGNGTSPELFYLMYNVRWQPVAS